MKKTLVFLLTLGVSLAGNAQYIETYASTIRSDDTLTFVSTKSENVNISSREASKSPVVTRIVGYDDDALSSEKLLKKTAPLAAPLSAEPVLSAEELRQIELKKQVAAAEGVRMNTGMVHLPESLPTTMSATAGAGNTRQNPITAGTFGAAFHYENVQNTGNFTDDYHYSAGKPYHTNEVFYKFTLTRSMTVVMSHCGSPLWDTYLVLLDANGNYITLNDDCSDACSSSLHSYLKRTLAAGTYYVVSEGYSSSGEIRTAIDGVIMDGDNLSVPIQAGSFSSGFQYVNSQNTVNFTNAYTGKPSNDVFYKFILQVPTAVTMSHCGSGLSDTYLHLLDEIGNRIDLNDWYSGEGKCSNIEHAYLKKNLLAGTYYVVSEGYSSNGSITTRIAGTPLLLGDILEYPINCGTYSDYFQYSDTKNTEAYQDNYHYGGIGKYPTKEVFYKFTITKKMLVTATHCGSAIGDTYLCLLDADGNHIAHNDDHIGEGRCFNSEQSVIEKELAAGTYYFVSEGNWENGSITTNITGLLNEFDYPVAPLDINVSQGGASGSVPIEVPAGINGVQPNLSLAYNSRSGFGLAGYGWTLSGLSVISVAGKTIYHDFMVAPPAPGNPLTLDGQRIISEGNFFTLENNRTVSIRADGSNYTVHYPDGSKATYTAYIAGYLWRISKYETLSGNYITYTYSGNLISKIDYGGNEARGTSHFMSARFYYEANPDKNSYYVGGQKLGYNNRIQRIDVLVDNYVFRTYNLYYNKGYYKQLSRIETKAGSQTSAPINVSYGYNTAQNMTTKEATLLTYYNNVHHGNALIYSGKFNSEHTKDQVIVMQKKETYAAGDKILLCELGNNDFACAYEMTVGSDFKQLFVTNVDEYPDDEIIRINSTTINVYSLMLGEMSLVKTSKASGATANSKYVAGDFDGRGKQSILSVTPNTSQMYIHRPMEGNTGGNYCPGFTYIVGDMLIPVDYDGDGKTDVAHINSAGLKIYTYSLTQGWIQIASTTSIYKGMFECSPKLSCNIFGVCTITPCRTLMAGDINGDGKTDILVSPACLKSVSGYVISSGAWMQFISKGDGGFELTTNTTLMTAAPAPTRGVNFSGGAFLQDMNGDGRADLVTADYDKIGIYYSDGSGYSNDNSRLLDKPDVDGLVTSINSLSPNNNRFLAYTYQNKVCWVSSDRDEQKEAFLTKTGFTQVDYKRIDMPVPSIHIKGSGASFPYRNMENEPLYVVSKLKTSSGSTVIADNSYFYHNAVLHLQGLGFCGFERIDVLDNLRSRIISETYEPLRFGLPKKSESPMQTVENTWTVSTTSSFPKNSRITLSKQKTTDKLTGNVSETVFQYNTYGFPTSKITTQGAMTKTVSTTYKTNVSGTNWSILPETETTVQTYGGKSLNRLTAIVYNAKNLPSKITEKTGPNKDKTVSEKNFEYDLFGNAISESVKRYGAGDVLTSTYSYSANGRFRLSETDPLRKTGTYIYSNFLGLLISYRDFKNNTTTYAYNGFGRLTNTVRPDGTSRQESFTGSFTSNLSADPKLTIIETGKPKQETLYDVFMREKSRGVANFSGAMLYSNIEYNSIGEVYKVSEPGNASRNTTYAYDLYGRPESVTEASGRTTSYSYSGRSTSVSENGITKTTTINAEGLVQKIADPAGEIVYSYRPDGQPLSITAPNGALTSFEYDDYGRQTKIIDPSAGTIEFGYDKNGYENRQIDARGMITETVYDKYGRPISTAVKNGSTTEMTSTYGYNGDGMLSSVSGGGKTTSYTYDNLLRTLGETETLAEGPTLSKTYSYSQGKLASVTYGGTGGTAPPTLGYIYNTQGYLSHITANGTAIKTINSKNNFGQTTQYTLGNGVVVNRSFDANGLPTQTNTAKSGSSLQNFGYSISPTKTVMNWRKDVKRNITETFGYDNLNRLTGFTRSGQTAASVAYNASGNITAKTDAGSFEYGISDKPYAVSRQTGNPGSVPPREQDISYNALQRPAVITENAKSATFFYGHDYARRKMEIRNGAGLQYTRYYLGDCYEKDVKPDNTTTERLYFGGTAYKAPAVYVRTNGGAWTLYYIHRDHLGSITGLSNTSGALAHEYSYDPWGRLRNPANHVAYLPDQAPELFLGRGFTGHEHLPQFGLINMNARLYDPVLGRFLSPDPYVQAPDFSQSFNRYSYCMNNPLMYVDEDGEFWWVIVIVYAVLEYGSQVYDNYNRGYDGWDAWFNQVDFFDVAVSAVAGGMSMLFPPAAPAIKYATPLVQNAVDYRPASQWKSIFHSGDRNISLKDWVINSSIDITITYTTSIWKKGMETPKSTSSNVRREIRDVVEEGINDVLQLRLKADINPDNRFHEGKLPQIPPGMQEPIDNRYRRNYEYPHDIDEVFLKAIPDARLFLLYKLR